MSEDMEYRTATGWIFRRYVDDVVAVTTIERERHSLGPIAAYQMPRDAKTLQAFAGVFFDPARKPRRA